MRSTLIALLAFASAAAAQQPAQSKAAPAGVDISARDGDRIIVDADDRIQIVRRRQVTLRTIYSAKERLLIALVDYSKPDALPDGMVDWAFNFYQVEGAWPLGPRWEGLTYMLEYQDGAMRQSGFVFETSLAVVHLVQGRQDVPRSAGPVFFLSYGGFSGSPRQGLSFAETEAIQLRDFVRSKATGATVSTVTPPPGSARGTIGTAIATTEIRLVDSTPPKVQQVGPDTPHPPRQTVTTPLPDGQGIPASDGDRVIVDDDARVQIVRRREATVRTIFEQGQRLLIMLADHAKPGELPDGRVDSAYNFYDVEGSWPLPARWEASTTLLQYEGDPTMPRGYALMTPQGLLQLWPKTAGSQQVDANAIGAVFFRGLSGGGGGLTFADAERVQLNEASKRQPTQ